MLAGGGPLEGVSRGSRRISTRGSRRISRGWIWFWCWSFRVRRRARFGLRGRPGGARAAARRPPRGTRVNRLRPPLNVSVTPPQPPQVHIGRGVCLSLPPPGRDVPPHPHRCQIDLGLNTDIYRP
eukprot:9483795-Pyramimonas_sp.AAC.1